MPWALSRWAQSLLVRMQTTLCVASQLCCGLLCTQTAIACHIHLLYACLPGCKSNNSDHTCSTVSTSPALVLSYVNAMCPREIRQACPQAVGQLTGIFAVADSRLSHLLLQWSLFIPDCLCKRRYAGPEACSGMGCDHKAWIL